MVRFWASVLLLAVSCNGTGCSPVISGAARDAATGGVQGATSPESARRIESLSAGALRAARDELLGDETRAELAGLLRDLDPEIQRVIRHSGKTTGDEVDVVLARLVRTRLRQAVRAAIDEGLGARTRDQVATLREELLGAPLEDDLAEAIDTASPHLSRAVADAVAASLVPVQGEVKSVQASAEAEAGRWRPIAIGFGVGTALLLACVLALGWVVRGHHKTITAMRAELTRAASRPRYMGREALPRSDVEGLGA